MPGGNESRGGLFAATSDENSFEWIARTSDEQIVSNVTACKLALTTRAHDFLTSTDSAVFLRGARAFTLQYPPIQRGADVSEQIESLSDLSDEQLEKMEAVRDAARLENAKGKDKEMIKGPSGAGKTEIPDQGRVVRG